MNGITAWVFYCLVIQHGGTAFQVEESGTFFPSRTLEVPEHFQHYRNSETLEKHESLLCYPPVYASTKAGDDSSASDAVPPALVGETGPGGVTAMDYQDTSQTLTKDMVCYGYDSEAEGHTMTQSQKEERTSHLWPSRGRRIPRFVPSKFVKRDFEESDYASDVEGDSRIRPRWAPAESDTDSEPVYRPIRSQLRMKRSSKDALEHLGRSFKEKADTMAEQISQGLGARPTAYKHEQREIQTGESQDPGLIYFKYDFGYEFGVVAPNEVKVETHPLGAKDEDSTSLPMTITHQKSNTDHIV